MAYISTIPQPTDRLKDSQNDILNNFIAIKAAFDINHVTFDAATQGKHNFVSFPVQAANPAAVVTEMQLYTKTSALTTVPELFLERGDGTVYEFSSATRAVTGWTRLPSGILLKWGSDTKTGSQTVTLPVAGTIPVFTTIFSVQLTVKNAAVTDTDEAVRVISFAAATGFNVYASSRSTTGAKAVTFEYLVIGV